MENLETPNLSQSQPQAQPQSKPRYAANNWIALAYVVIITLTWIDKDPVLSGLMFWVALITGIIAAASFINRIAKANRSTQNQFVKMFFAFISVCGGIVIFIISFIAGFVGYFNGHPIQGD